MGIHIWSAAQVQELYGASVLSPAGWGVARVLWQSDMTCVVVCWWLWPCDGKQLAMVMHWKAPGPAAAVATRSCVCEIILHSIAGMSVCPEGVLCCLEWQLWLLAKWPVAC